MSTGRSSEASTSSRLQPSQSPSGFAPWTLLQRGQTLLLVAALGSIAWMALRVERQDGRLAAMARAAPTENPTSSHPARPFPVAPPVGADQLTSSAVQAPSIAERSVESTNPSSPSQTVPPQSPEEQATRRIERYERMLATFAAQNPADYERLRADRLTRALEKRLAETTLAAGVRTGSIECRGSMCSLEVSFGDSGQASALTALAHTAVIDVAESGQVPPLTHLLTRPRSDGSGSVGRFFFEWRR